MGHFTQDEDPIIQNGFVVVYSTSWCVMWPKFSCGAHHELLWLRAPQLAIFVGVDVQVVDVAPIIFVGPTRHLGGHHNDCELHHFQCN